MPASIMMPMMSILAGVAVILVGARAVDVGGRHPVLLLLQLLLMGRIGVAVVVMVQVVIGGMVVVLLVMVLTGAVGAVERVHDLLAHAVRCGNLWRTFFIILVVEGLK